MENKKLTLAEAFQSLKSLTEDVFEVDDDGIARANSFINDDIDEETDVVIDPLAQTEDELQDSYMGKAILDCVICQSKIYKNPEEVIINEDGSLANVGEVCPYCQSSDGFKVIGQVAPYKPVEEDKVETEVEVNPDEDSVKIDIEDKEDEDLEESKKASDKKDKSVWDKIEKYLKEDDGNQIKSTSLDESMENVSIETDKEKITVTSEPKEEVEEVEDTETMIAPVDETTEAEFKSESEETEDEDSGYEDIDVDEFEEESFNRLGEKYLKKVYENVKSFKTTQGSVKGNSLKLEGLITFKSGKQAKTNFIFESKAIDKSGRMKLEGLNKQLAKGNKAFTLIGRMDGNKFLSESLTYNYTAKDEKSGKPTKLYGRVVK